jgi:hypothetical protein
MMALDVLSTAVPPEMMSAVVSKDMAKEAWDAIKTMRVKDGRMRASTAQQLLQQFKNAMFNKDETIEDFSMWLSGLVQHLATLREKWRSPRWWGSFFVAFLTIFDRLLWRSICSSTSISSH